MSRGQELGRKGEELAARHLAARGWQVLARNWRDGPRELDLVVFRDGVLAFVEVKTRGGSGCGSPLEALTRRKRREVERAASAWLRTFSDEFPGFSTLRFDVVAVEASPEGKVTLHHLEDAWWKGG